MIRKRMIGLLEREHHGGDMEDAQNYPKIQTGTTTPMKYIAIYARSYGIGSILSYKLQMVKPAGKDTSPSSIS